MPGHELVWQLKVEAQQEGDNPRGGDGANIGKKYGKCTHA
jgi:hypothetical protein